MIWIIVTSLAVSGLTFAIYEFRAAFDRSIPRELRRPKQIALACTGLLIAGGFAAFVLWPRGGAAGGKVRTRHGDTIELASLWEQHRVVVFFYPGRGDFDSILQDLE